MLSTKVSASTAAAHNFILGIIWNKAVLGTLDVTATCWFAAKYFVAHTVRAKFRVFGEVLDEVCWTVEAATSGLTALTIAT